VSKKISPDILRCFLSGKWDIISFIWQNFRLISQKAGDDGRIREIRFSGGQGN
jgi:hypothetical protein